MGKVVFELSEKDNPRGVEEIALHVQFIEGSVRGGGDSECKCMVITREDGDGGNAFEIDRFTSWEEMKSLFPTLLDFLKEQSISPHWESGWRGFKRLTWFESVEGAEGLYDLSSVVAFDHEELANEEPEDDGELA